VGCVCCGVLGAGAVRVLAARECDGF